MEKKYGTVPLVICIRVPVKLIERDRKDYQNTSGLTAYIIKIIKKIK